MGNAVARQANSVVRILQVTDTHLYEHAGGKLVGMNCDEGLKDVLELARQREQAAGSSPACVLFTGDASQDNSLASYRRLEKQLASLGVPQYWIPGNHDELAAMHAAVGRDNACFRNSIALGDWRILQLNSSVPGQVHGRLAETMLDWLRDAFRSATEAHLLVTLHHNPVPVAATWLQKHALQNPQDLFDLLDVEPRVRAVLFGHIHHELSTTRKGVNYLGSPSTCVQFHPSSHDFALDALNPGYRWLDLHADGTLETGINRVEGKRYDIDFSGIGY